MNAFALLTSAGPAAIAAFQLRGPAVPAFVASHLRSPRGAALSLTQKSECPLFQVARAKLNDSAGEVLDDILVSVHAGPPIWELRLFLHGSPWLVRHCSETLAAAGFVQQTGPVVGLWPARDIVEAEAHALLHRMPSLIGARWLLGQPARLRAAIDGLLSSDNLDAGRQACRELAGGIRVLEWFTKPARIALIGPPNTGKSTLANALADQEVSLTSPHPGTTRDWVDIPTIVRGFPISWLDTAGLRHDAADLEAAGIAKTMECIRSADAVLVVLDATRSGLPGLRQFLEAYGGLDPVCVALNKQDLTDHSPSLADSIPSPWRARALPVSAATGAGLNLLTERVLRGVGRSADQLTAPGAFTERQVSVLNSASEARDLAFYRSLLKSCLAG